MSAARNGVLALVIMVLVAVPLAGSAAEGGPISAQAGVRLVGGFVEQLKQEDDEAEVKELAEHEPNREEREEAKEQAETAQLEEAQAQEQSQSETS